MATGHRLRSPIIAIVLLSCALTRTACGEAEAQAAFSHASLDSILHAHVDSAGLVDYARLNATSRTNLERYIDLLARTSPVNCPGAFPTDDDKLAYWINAYNAFVLSAVASAYPVESVEDIGSLQHFFRQRQFVAGGIPYTLDQIESSIIREQFHDPRIHFVVNCAARSCPALENRAFSALDLQQRLEEAARRFAANQVHLRLDEKAGRLHLSQLLNWYGEDFTKWFPKPRPKHHPQHEAPSIIDYLARYAPQREARFLLQHRDVDIVFIDYDWTINARK